MSRVVDSREFFGQIARKYDRDYAPSSDASKAKMTRVLSEFPRKVCNVLDLGLGTGRELPPLLDAGHRVTGVDIAPEMIEIAKKRSRTIEIHLADFWTPPLPFANASFDAALALHGTLAHPPDDAMESMSRLADELARLVRPGGVIVFEVPSPAFVVSLEKNAPDVAQAITSDRSMHTDAALGIAIEARTFPAERWIEAFCRHFRVRVEPISDVEQLVVGRRME